MAPIIYYVVLPFVRNEEGELVAEDGIEAPSSGAAIVRAFALVGHKAGVVAFTRSGDLDLGEYGDPLILVRLGDTPDIINSPEGMKG